MGTSNDTQLQKDTQSKIRYSREPPTSVELQCLIIFPASVQQVSLTLACSPSKDSSQLGLYRGNSKATGYVQTY